MSFELLYAGILQGLILATISFGMMIPFRFLNFSDLTAEGAYPLGGAVYAGLTLLGAHQALAIIAGVLAGGLLAVGTAQLVLHLRIPSLLAGIVLSTMTYSIVLRILGKPNVALFNRVEEYFWGFLLSGIVGLCVILFSLFLRTDFGLRFRGVGKNLHFMRHQKISVGSYITLGLFMAGCLFGLAGAFMVYAQNFMDVGMGSGIVIHGLASLMIGEAIIGHQNTLKQLIAPFIGACVYQQIQGLVLSVGLAPSDLKFFTGSIVLMVFFLKKREKNVV